ncbi:competence protein CoiA family protein [Deltaproteobacteria bacterium IMCC39524]|nr:competence protein CoiA family protein [Deltaproteobacteria bacterium IMCC39524]
MEKANVSDLGPFLCVGCGASLVSRLGQKNIKHFAHVSGEGCGGETYLHRLGKRVFIETYTNCIKAKKPFIVALETNFECTHYQDFLGYPCRYSQVEEYDLTRYFDKVEEEMWHDGFRPDVLLSSSTTGDALYIEIAVFHKSSEEKIGSGRRIIEYLLETEDDVPILKKTSLTDSTPGVEILNFNPKPKLGDLCKGSCEHTFNYFVVDRKGRASIISSTPANLVRDVTGEAVVYSAPCRERDNTHLEFKSFLIAAINDGVQLRNCIVCVESQPLSTQGHLRCNKHHKKITSSEAFRCRDFSIHRS